MKAIIRLTVAALGLALLLTGGLARSQTPEAAPPADAAVPAAPAGDRT